MAQQGNDRYADYVSVAERVGKFYEDWLSGRIHTVIMEHDAAAGTIIFRAEAYRELAEESPSATGHASEARDAMPSHMRASYLEVCESSAVGRALMLLGYETKRQHGEQRQAQRQSPAKPQPAAERPAPVSDDSDDLDAEISALLSELGKESAPFSKYVQQTHNVEGPWYDQDVPLKQKLVVYLRKLAAKARKTEATTA